ncbi:hypothetical protein [Paraglaciecola sp. MB-3u-78]|uniref:hypothetical protein n=1 Tax=Paraglaciecola sp. MB-3u-78 TaxID=2058332 RepID=UPI000C339832|nr:hypothetical protein [Paraglaciecola sp. MB-3u-78]PKG99152.1 hypothetical protein CXF95_07620 [Paraglaciecola sp. MB-3u-78]
MVFTIIIVLIVALVLVGVIVNAIQQHKNKVETERRTELSKQKGIIDNTEAALLGADQLPISQRLIFIMQRRMLGAMKAAKQMGNNTAGSNTRIKTTEEALKTIDVSKAPPSEENFQLPQGDKQVIQFIRGIKTLRAFLSSEFKKNRIESRVFLAEDKLLERLQLRANVDTLMRRGEVAIKNNQLGSARQCLEKAIGALSAQPNPDEFITVRKAQLEEQLVNIESNLKNANSRDVAKKEELEKNDLDDLFAEKKKW